MKISADPANPDFLIVAYGNAAPTDTHLASTIHCEDDEIIVWLEQREARQRRKRNLNQCTSP